MKMLENVVRTMQKAWDVDISCYDEGYLQKTIEKRIDSLSAPDLAAYCQILANSQPEKDTLSKALCVHYSTFFSNPLTFALLEQMILPELIEEKRRMNCDELRIWSAGCAAGQEAWSLAILLDELLVAREVPVVGRIFATDSSKSNLNLARQGIYEASYLQNVRLKHLHRYFERQGEKYAVAMRLKNQVDFSVFELFDPKSFCPPESIHGGFDLIYCSNVLLYYRPFYRRIILDKVWHALGPHGYFVTGEAEMAIVNESDGFSPVMYAAATFTKARKRA